MRKLTLISTLIFSTLMFSSTSFAGWTKIGKIKSIDANIKYLKNVKLFILILIKIKIMRGIDSNK